jgi:hypothetical protein
MGLYFLAGSGYIRGLTLPSVSCLRADFLARIRARGRIYLPISSPVGSGIRRYPNPRVKLPSLLSAPSV